ncbi:hypothetical protein K3G39_07045 [Pontibacter sp. HSC-14F20]|uniref:hypothetical protein n=1 Tax=Pontibacter sp. HSC-14F20 TaxID=2864136 RepID=UPI001C72A64E|nr:hypothetical protein [Pontibacter sp. HSC-14F20]MBX0332990.1 hypothetical protein [Pontibacter sp. HSC-14F20]
MIEILLGDTYYNQNFFNVSIEFTDLFAGHRDPITIQLGDNPNDTIQGHINRTANQNGAPRIMGGVQMNDWIQANFNQSEIMTVQVLNPQSIVLMPN